MKILLRVVLGSLLLLAVALVAAFAFLDPLIVRAVEKGGSYGTGVETKLGGADAGLFSGELQLDELSIANPPGFRPEPFLYLGSASAQWNNRSLLSDTIRVEELVLDGVTIHLERSAQGTNWGVILDNLKRISSKDKPPPDAQEGAKKVLSVGRIEILDVYASLHLAGVPVASGSYEVRVPRVAVGEFRSDGSTSEVVAQLMRTLIEAILDAAVEGGASILPKDVIADLNGRLDGLRGEVEKRAEEALGGVDRQLDREVEEAQKKLDEKLKGVGGIFDKKKKD